MQSPHDEGRDARRLRLEYGQVADAGLVRSAPIVDDQDIARPRRTECLEEDVDAAVMAGRECAPGDPCTGSNGCNPRRRHAQRHASPQTTVGDKGVESSLKDIARRIERPQ